MANKTIYVKESDLALWEVAQAEIGESISSLFSQFLRERIKKLAAFVHVLHTGLPILTAQENFAVMIAPLGRTGSGEAMSPRYLTGREELCRYLEAIGISKEQAREVETDLRHKSSVSIRAEILRSTLIEIEDERFTLFLKPAMDKSAEQLKVNLLACPVNGKGLTWHASFDSLDQLIITLEDRLGLPPIQLAKLRQVLLAGEQTEVGGHYGVPRQFNPEQLLKLGMVESGSLGGAPAMPD